MIMNKLKSPKILIMFLLTLTLVFSSVGSCFALPSNDGVAFANGNALYANGSSNSMYSFSFYDNNVLSLSRVRYNNYNAKEYVNLRYPASLGSTYFDGTTEHPTYVEFKVTTTSKNDAVVRPVSTVTPLYGCEYDSDDKFTILDNEYSFIWRGSLTSFPTSGGWTFLQWSNTNISTCTVEVVGYAIDGIWYIGEEYIEEEPEIDTYSFTVPYGSDLRITGDDISMVYVRAKKKSSGTLGNYLQTPNLSSVRYSSSNSFDSSVSVNLSGSGSRSFNGGYSSFEGYCVPSNSFTIYNRVSNTDTTSVNVYVNVTGRNVSGVYYSPMSNEDIISGNSSATTSNGAFTITGGGGTPDNPYITQPLTDSGSVLPYDALTPVIDNSSSDGVVNDLVERLNSIFSIPSSIVNGLGNWLGSTSLMFRELFSIFPSALTDLCVSFFGIALVVGVIKLFL